MNLRPRCRAEECSNYVDALGKVFCDACYRLLLDETKNHLAEAWGDARLFEIEVVRACRELGRVSRRHRMRPDR